MNRRKRSQEKAKEIDTDTESHSLHTQESQKNIKLEATQYTQETSEALCMLPQSL